jgi:ribosomal-protein-alanine N-acetyltransferase
MNLSQIVMGPFRSAFLGYYAFEPFAGRGYMRAAMPQLLRFAFDELGLHRVQANVQPGNEASIALVRGAGFHREGFSPRYLFIRGAWRDHEQWVMLAEDLDRGTDAGSGRAVRDPT